VVEALYQNEEKVQALKQDELEEIGIEVKRGPFYRAAQTAEMETL